MVYTEVDMKLMENLTFPLFFPYRVSTPARQDNYGGATIIEVEHWAKEAKIDCVITSTVSYFKTEKEALYFMLRWS